MTAITPEEAVLRLLRVPRQGGAALLTALALSVAGPTLARAAGPAGAAHVTRAGAEFAEREEALLAAQRARRVEAADALLAEDFEMIVAQSPGSPVSREDWLEAALRPGAGDHAVEALTARESGDQAVVSFLLRARPAREASGVGPFFVVDLWQRQGGEWRLAVRHIGPGRGSRKGLPGDAPSQVDPRKKY